MVLVRDVAVDPELTVHDHANALPAHLDAQVAEGAVPVSDRRLGERDLAVSGAVRSRWPAPRTSSPTPRFAAGEEHQDLVDGRTPRTSTSIA